mmetsp:Transcript_75052/g.172020  ORF Transcript_75052/g.172020 Transcript_75052/m.172020 type:complete len:362 (-) Transcript_75052:775-1860(-)
MAGTALNRACGCTVAYSWASARGRLKLEWLLIRSRALEWIAHFVFLSYFNTFVFRTWAFYWHRPLVSYIPEEWCDRIWQGQSTCLDHAHELRNSGKLDDVVHRMVAFTPDAKVPELMETGLVLGLSAVLVVGAFRDPVKTNAPRVYLGHVVTRMLRTCSVVWLLRPMCFLSTSLPGPADKCSGWTEHNNRPRSFSEVVTNFSLVSENCGDLVFSGHTAGIVLVVAMFWQYGQQLWWPRTGLVLVLKVVLVPYVLSLVLVIVASRNHYTIDVVVALILSPLVWRWYQLEFPDRPVVSFTQEFRRAEQSHDSTAVAEFLRQDDDAVSVMLPESSALLGGCGLGVALGVYVAAVITTFVGLVSG